MAKTNSVSFSYTEFENHEELNPSDKELIIAARDVAMNAYAPYSKYRVGAAVRLDNGTIVTGANVENSAFPTGICAERNALSTSVVRYPDNYPVAIAVAAFNENGIVEEPVPPCGNCRQFIAEEESRHAKEIRMILSGRERTYVIDSISNLLPLQFNKINLKISLPEL
jgi:cytidine deaminase